jgi:serine/threonine-protein kinase
MLPHPLATLLDSDTPTWGNGTTVPDHATFLPQLAASTDSGDDELAPGTVVADRYRVGERLGAGAMGAVYYAEHLTVRRPVAIKVLATQWMGRRDMVDRFRTEAQAASAAGHPNIIEVFDAGDLPSGQPYLVMEYLAGRELYALIQESNGMSPRRAAGYGRAIARALTAAHGSGIVHRDLKAENVMVVERGGEEALKVLDFGVAQVASGGARRTAPGMVIGTPEYIAPEQVRGQPATPAIDVYAFGVLMHEMLVGTTPFEAAESLDVLAMKTAGPAAPVTSKRADIPTSMARLVDRCLEMDPTARPTAPEIVQALDAFLDEPARPLVPIAVPPARRSAWRSVAVVVGIAALTGVGLAWPRAPLRPTAPAVPAVASASRTEGVPPPSPPRRDPEPTVSNEGAETSGSATSTDGGEETGSTATDPPPTDPPPAVGPRPKPPVDTPLPPPPSADPPTAKLEPDTPVCRANRDRAVEARKVQDWDGVLRYTAAAACFSSKLERQRLRVQAFLESGKHDRCIAAATASTDAQIAKWVRLCERKRAG